MADPLSAATRATKRNLLFASVLAISANAFNITIDKIPLAGLSINFDDRLFAFLLVVALLYFLCTFVLYYVIDIKNIETTKHQAHAEATYIKKTSDAEFEHAYAKKIAKRAPEVLMSDYWLPADTDRYGQPIRLDYFRERNYELRQFPNADDKDRNIKSTTRERARELYAVLDKRVDAMIAQYPAAYRRNKRKEWLLLFATRTMYFTRNYFFDGLLPITLGVFALVAILGHIDLHWIQRFLPSFRVLAQ